MKTHYLEFQAVRELLEELDHLARVDRLALLGIGGLLLLLLTYCLL